MLVLALVGRLAPLPVRLPHHQIAILEAKLEQAAGQGRAALSTRRPGL